MRLSRASIGATLSVRFLLTQDGTKALDIARDHGQCHIALEAGGPMIQAAVQAVDLQGVDGGLHRRVLMTQVEQSGSCSRSRWTCDSLPFFGSTTCGIIAANAS